MRGGADVVVWVKVGMAMCETEKIYCKYNGSYISIVPVVLLAPNQSVGYVPNPFNVFEILYHILPFERVVVAVMFLPKNVDTVPNKSVAAPIEPPLEKKLISISISLFT